MIKLKGWLKHIEIEIMRRRIHNKDRNEENNGALEKNDERADINVENVGIDHAHSVNEEPSVIWDESDSTNIETEIHS